MIYGRPSHPNKTAARNQRRLREKANEVQPPLGAKAFPVLLPDLPQTSSGLRSGEKWVQNGDMIVKLRPSYS